MAWILGIKSYLLGTETRPNGDEAPHRAQDHGQGLGAAHQALLQRDVPVGFQPYDRPTMFVFRLVGLIVLMCVSLVLGSLITLTIPVWIGRHGMSIWSVGSHINHHITHTTESSSPTTEESSQSPTRPHELYTAALGIYLCWVLSRAVAVAVNLFPQGREAVIEKLRHWINIGASYAMATIIFVLMLGVVPLLFGLLLELVVIVPLRLI